MIEFEMEGFDELEKELSNLEKKARDLNGEHEVSLTELFPPSFMQRHTDFASVEEMFEKSPFEVETSEDFEAIPDAEWDQFIASETRFERWEEMLEEASTDWASRQLGLS